jgi:hypothetical protein
MLIKQYAQQVPWALQIVYRERPYQAAAVLLGLLAAAGFSWATQLVSYFQGSGLFWDVTLPRLIQVLVLAGSLGLLVPMQIYVLRKGKRSATTPPDMLTTPHGRESSSSRLRSFVPGFSGGLGAMLGIACLTCCAPLLFPAPLVLLGASGSFILTLNIRLVQWSGPLFLGSLLFCGVALLLQAQNVTAACILPQATAEKRETANEDRVPA